MRGGGVNGGCFGGGVRGGGKSGGDVRGGVRGGVLGDSATNLSTLSTMMGVPEHVVTAFPFASMDCHVANVHFCQKLQSSLSHKYSCAQQISTGRHS